jgi:hypothetical protein
MIADGLVRRQGAVLDPGLGVLHAEQFQIAYTTTDMARAQDVFARRYGVHAFRTLKGALPEGGRIHVELAWVGPVMYELLTADGPGSDVYRRGLPDDGFAIRHHHLGYFVHDREQWDALMLAVEDGGWHMPNRRNNPGFLESCFVDAPELGHYLEYVFPEEAGRQFFEDVPHN